MNRRCARPGCGTAAAATLTYDYGTSTVTLQGLAEESHPMAYDLCDPHARNLVVPRGWALQDRRVASPYTARLAS